LDGLNGHALIDQFGGECVPEKMRMDVTNPGTPSSLSTLFAQGAV